MGEYELLFHYKDGQTVMKTCKSLKNQKIKRKLNTLSR